MTSRFFPRAALAAILAFTAPAVSFAQPSQEVRLIRAGEAVQLREDRAYLLLRIARKGVGQTPVILRVLDEAELERYEAAKQAVYAKKPRKVSYEDFTFDYDGAPNLHGLGHNKALVEDEDVSTILAEVRPGQYILYGHGYSGFLFQCLCLGTVGFTAAPARITDLGTFMTDTAEKVSVHPELAGETGIGPTASMDYNLFAAALRPVGPGDTLPAAVDAAKVDPVALHAVGPFVDPNVMLINRLAAIPGVLAYREGRVIDVMSGQEAMPR
jgi:hypothetical protein